MQACLVELPTGIVTFLLTDVEGSTRLWREDPEAAAETMGRHTEVIASTVRAHGGWQPVEQGEGDSTVSVFVHPDAAMAAALELQRLLAPMEAAQLALSRRTRTPRATSGWAALTPAEERAVDLVAVGLSNPQIAEKLFIGISTVKTHLVHIYQKLGIDSRPALVAAAATRPGSRR